MGIHSFENRDELEKHIIELCDNNAQTIIINGSTAHGEIKNFSDFDIVSHKRYFFPLGKLKSGKYTLHIQTEEDINFTFEVISSKFDSFLNQSVCSCTEEKVFNFVLEENTNYFLRIHSKKPLHLKSLKLSPSI